MSSCLRGPTLLLIASVMLLAAVAARGEISVGAWAPLYRGVDHAQGTADSAEPRLQKINALRIDLLAPGVEFLSTPGNGADPDETTSQTASQFLVATGTRVAINANFYAPALPPPLGSNYKDLEGLAISQGIQVSAQETDPALNRGQVLLITADNQARLASTINNPIDLTGVYTAVCGDARILVNGDVNHGPPGEAHPRTAVGISQDDRFLIVITIDGRQDGYSEGASLRETSQWLVRFGAFNGIALDGGGSTTMVRSDGAGAAIVLNSPMGAGWLGGDPGQRSNGNHLGVFARNRRGDYDGDSEINEDDSQHWPDCMSGPDAGPCEPSCVPLDFDDDCDVDLRDYAEFQAAFAS